MTDEAHEAVMRLCANFSLFCMDENVKLERGLFVDRFFALKDPFSSFFSWHGNRKYFLRAEPKRGYKLKALM